ncbi:MAG: D-sedoheptulose 7-phosphate isomerase [Oligoflexia bacterium]|nr:D-sedoheptulose 7-phosphate isomerase [Oligoflexia bacterium]
MTSVEIWKSSLKQAQETIDAFTKSPDVFNKLERFTQMLVETYQNGGVVFSCGNGGSHCDAMHFAEELTGRYRKDRKPLGALALGDASHVTCVSNDFGFEHIFERQVEALARPGDALILLSTSGNSKNQILAVEAAKSKKVKTIAMLGRDGGQLKNLCDHNIIVPAQTSDRIQEIHIKLLHTVIETVERVLMPELYK